MLIYSISLGWDDYQPETWWVPSEHFIYPQGHLTVFFNADGILFYTDEQELLGEAVTVTTITAAVNLFNLIKGSGMIGELGRIRELASMATRASQVQLEAEVELAEAGGGWI
jgi:hypothetical protein